MRVIRHIIVCLILCGSSFAYTQTWDELNDQSRQAYSKGDYELAIAASESALKLAIKKYGKQSTQYSTSLSNLGTMYGTVGEYEKAEANLLEALAIREKIVGKISSDYVMTLNSLADLYSDKGDYSKSEKYYLETIDIAKKMNGNMEPPYALFLNGVGLLYKTIGRYDDAVKCFEEALKVLKHNYGEIHRDYATLLNNLGTVYKTSGDYLEAEKTFLRVLEIRKKLKDENTTQFAALLNNLAEIYDRKGDVEKAESTYLQSKAIFENRLGKMHPTYALCINNIGLFYLSQNKFKVAEDYLLEAMEIRRTVFGEEHPDYAASLNSLASMYQDMKNWDKAEEYYLKGLELRKKIFGDDHPEYAAILNNLALLYTSIGELDAARTLYLKAYEINVKHFGEDHGNVANILNNLGDIAFTEKDYKSALDYHQRSLRINEKIFGKESEVVADGLLHLGKIYSSTGFYEKAEENVLKALAIKKKIYGTSHPSYKEGINHLVGLYLKTGDLNKAMPYLSVCAENFTKGIGELSSFLSEDELEKYMIEESADMDVYYSMVWRSNNAFPEANPIVLNMSLFVRGIQLRSSETLKRDIFNRKDTALISTYAEWIGYKSQIADQLSLPMESRSSNLTNWISEANSLEKNLVKGSGAFKTEQVALNLEWKKVRQGLAPDEAAVEFVSFQYYDGSQWTDSVFYFAMIVRSSDSIPSYTRLFEERQLREIVKGDSLKTFANLLYTDAQVRFIHDHDISYGDSLYQLVWRPLENRLKDIKKIYFSPAGLLHYLSFDAIPVNDQQLLSDLYQLQRLTSIGKMIEEGNASTNVNMVALYGGLDYNTDTTQLKTLARKDQALTGNHTSRSLEDTINRGGSWIYLPGTKIEMTNIQQLFEKNKTSVTAYTGQSGTEESIKALDGERSPAILHLSTHGFFFPNPQLRSGKEGDQPDNVFEISENPLLRSGLILSGANYVWKGGKPIDGIQDGILTAYEVSNLYLPNTKLVVMSACETGLGDVKGSEGVYGLQRAFKMAGVDYIIVTLWQVLDKETSEFMILFYQNLLVKKSIPDAFKMTQDTMKNKYREEPYKWAGFVLIH